MKQEKSFEERFDDVFGENIRNCKCECHSRPLHMHHSVCIHCSFVERDKRIKQFASQEILNAKKEENQRILEIIKHWKSDNAELADEIDRLFLYLTEGKGCLSIQ